MSVSRRTRAVLLTLAVAMLTLPLAFASVARDAELHADCDGYTVWVTGDYFDPDSVITVDYFFLLEYLGPDPAGEDVSVHGQLELTYQPDQPFVMSKSVSWVDELGARLPCGDYRLVHGAGLPDTRIEWYDVYGGRHVEHMVERDWDGFLSCPCDVGDLICRTPGFWGTHAGEEWRGRRQGRNITQEVIDAVGFLSVCGEMIDATSVGEGDSAIEAICVSPAGNKRLQLARHLTAAALNCAMSNGDPSCGGLEIGAAFSTCDMACAANDTSAFGDCNDEIDCFNNGGVLLASGMCQIGTCGGDGLTPCEDDDSCEGFGEENARCIPTPGNCHDQPLVSDALGLDFDPPGPAGSSKACNSANRNQCTIFDCDAAEGARCGGGKKERGRGK